MKTNAAGVVEKRRQANWDNFIVRIYKIPCIMVRMYIHISISSSVCASYGTAQRQLDTRMRATA